MYHVQSTSTCGEGVARLRKLEHALHEGRRLSCKGGRLDPPVRDSPHRITATRRDTTQLLVHSDKL